MDAAREHEEICIEAANIISSLSYGSFEALKSLVANRLQRSLLYALSYNIPLQSNSTVSALTRALKTYSTSVADAVGPSLWGLQDMETNDLKVEASSALDEVFEASLLFANPYLVADYENFMQISSLDIWLPLLLSSSTQISLSIMWIVGNCVRNQYYRDTLIHWLPSTERPKESKGKRGWEKPDIKINGPNRGGGWLIRNLYDFIQSKDFKVQEAALTALAALYKDTPSVVTFMRRSLPEGDGLHPFVILTRSRNPDVQIAACLCIANMTRASGSPPLGHHGAPPTYEGSPVLTIIHVLNNLISSSTTSQVVKTKACYILALLVKDEREIEKIAVEVGALDKVTSLMLDITPKDKFNWDDDEPESIANLRQAILMATATLTLHWDGIRRDLSAQPFFPCIHICMSHPHFGVRYAACQCARVLCRSISVLRTSVVDSGMGITLFDILNKTDEDSRVQAAALAGICNLLNDFSPMRVVLLEEGLIPVIVQFIHRGDKSLRLNALWAIRNALFNATSREKCMIMQELGWDVLTTLLRDPEEEICEQAITIVRNLADNDPDLLFEGIGLEHLGGSLEHALKSPNPYILEQALMAVTNIGNASTENLMPLLRQRRFLESIRSILQHPNIRVRRASGICVLKLIRRSTNTMMEAGFEAELRKTIGEASPFSIEEDRETHERIKIALGFIERKQASIYSMGTENRRPVAEYIPPQTVAYDFILFRAPEVKDINVETAAPQAPPVNSVQNDPAVIGVSQGSAPAQGYDGYGYNPNPPINVPPVPGPVPASIPVQPSVPSAPVPMPIPAAATTSSHPSAQVTQSTSSQPPRRREANGRHSNTSTIRTALESVERAMGDLRVEAAAARGGRRPNEIQAGNIHVPATDFDFVSSNAKFNKVALAQPIEESDSDSDSDAETNPSNAGDNNKDEKKEKEKKAKEPAYNRAKSFFDSLTPNSLPPRGGGAGGQARGAGRGGRGRGGYGRSRREEEAQRNLMTFGETAPPSQSPNWNARRGGRRGGATGGYSTQGISTNGRPG
ncbi:hypothetical protein Clacol_006304 [Clathrus columnatus]|uniref:Armadillo repeat-containing protein 8 n=1 Tax=Clathrus columnatus TaxID=1419009 RepID=A0AAV5AEW3_9AGAM|nr:hypothetical protein Clacol_006304 [Clathrus columnatus]